MLDHYLQRDIVYRLAFSEGERFSELKPDDIESKLFTYHLKKLVVAGFVEKSADGLYRLTSEGRRVGVGAFKQRYMSTDRAYSILLLSIRRQSDGAWLFYRRKTHPLRGLGGFMHTTPISSEDTLTRAYKECLQKTGLEGQFEVIGNGYFRVYNKDELESFTHFTLLKCDDIQGELIQNDELAEYYWESNPDFSGEGMLPNTVALKHLYDSPDINFIEETLQL